MTGTRNNHPSYTNLSSTHYGLIPVTVKALMHQIGADVDKVMHTEKTIYVR